MRLIGWKSPMTNSKIRLIRLVIRFVKFRNSGLGKVSKDPIFPEKYWYYFHCPKNVLRSILSFVFWIFLLLDTAVHLESVDSKQNAISKSLFQDSLLHMFWAMRKMRHTFWKKLTFSGRHILIPWCIWKGFWGHEVMCLELRACTIDDNSK